MHKFGIKPLNFVGSRDLALLPVAVRLTNDLCREQRERTVSLLLAIDTIVLAI